MLGVTDYGTFVVTVLIFLLIPGPGNLALITSTSKGGIRGGLAATMGVIAGDQVLMWLAVAGVATLLRTTPLAVNHQSMFVASTISFNLAPGKTLSDAVAYVNETMREIGVAETAAS